MGTQFEDSFESLDKIPEDMNTDTTGDKKDEKGEIIGAFSGQYQNIQL